MDGGFDPYGHMGGGHMGVGYPTHGGFGGGYGAPMGGMGGGPMQAPSGSWKAEAMLDEWVEAKRAKDYSAADAIRDELRSNGLDPDRLRPRGYNPPFRPPSGSAANEALLDEWVEAKRAKDFATADRIRDDLRAAGVDPDRHRPKG